MRKVIPAGTNVLLELDDEDSDARTGSIVMFGSAVPQVYRHSPGEAEEVYRGLKVGDKVILSAEIPNWVEIPPDRDDPEAPPMCIVDVKDILYIKEGCD